MFKLKCKHALAQQCCHSLKPSMRSLLPSLKRSVAALIGKSNHFQCTCFQVFRIKLHVHIIQWYKVTDETIWPGFCPKLQGHQGAQYCCSRTCWLCKPRVWIKTAIFCSTLNLTGCLAAGRTRKTFGPILTQETKGGTSGAGLARTEGTAREGDGGSVFRAAFTSLNTGLHEALVVGECGYYL